jgi:hypothetical protein
MSYFKGKVTALRNEYTDPDKKQVIAQRGGKCELCGKEDGEKAVFGPTHYIKRHIIFKTHIHIHVIAYHGQIHKICICDSCHLGYHLFNRLDQDAYLGNRRIGDSFDKPKKKRIVHVIKKRKKRVDSRK